MSQKTYLTILKYGIYVSLIAVFLVFRGLLFPYITSKQIFFNILMEILFVLWLAFVIKYPEYRPWGRDMGKINWVSYALLAFFLALTISSVVGVDFNLSFWGDVERMLGVFHLLHFLVFYFIIITVFREWKDWKMLFIVSVIFAIFVSLHSFTQNAYATIGNHAYVAGYLIFNIYFCVLLFKRESNQAIRWIWLLPILLLMPAFYRVSISGAMVGLGFSFIVAVFMYGVFSKNKKFKIATLATFAILTLSVVYLFILDRDNFLTQRSQTLSEIVTDINVEKNTFQTRLISWRAALKDFPNHPFFGTGHGNFAITFDKYFDASFYDQTRGETYFDRAHNNLVDILSTSGLAGLLTYITFIGLITFLLIRNYLRGHIDIHELVILGALFTAYFVQNLAVFDSLVTYMASMILFAYIIWLTRQGEESLAQEDKSKVMKTLRRYTKDRAFENKEIYTLLGVGLVVIFIMYQYNIKPWNMLVATIDGQRAWAQRDVVGTYQNYDRALDYNTVLDRDSRTSMIRLFAGNLNALRSLDSAMAEKIIDFNVDMAKRNVEYNPGDSLNQMLLSQMLNTASSYYSKNPEKFSYYSEQAVAAIDVSIAASPERIPIYFQKAQIHLTRGENDKAIDTLRLATTLSETYEMSFCHLGRTQLFYRDEEGGYQNLDQCIDKGGWRSLEPAGAVKNYINHYLENQDWERVIKLYQRLTKLENKNAEHWTRLAQLYAQIGERDKAIEAAGKAMQIDPSIEQYGQEFIDSL